MARSIRMRRPAAYRSHRRSSRGPCFNDGASWATPRPRQTAGTSRNARELRKQLDLSANSPLPHVLLAAWRRWSYDCLARLDGVFVIALYRDDELVLYRDPSGLLDLYTAPAQTDRSASPRTWTPCCASGVERRLARRSLHEYLRFGDIAAPDTLFEGVRAVEAGQLLRWSARRHRSDAMARTASRRRRAAGRLRRRRGGARRAPAAQRADPPGRCARGRRPS